MVKTVSLDPTLALLCLVRYFSWEAYHSEYRPVFATLVRIGGDAGRNILYLGNKEFSGKSETAIDLDKALKYDLGAISPDGSLVAVVAGGVEIYDVATRKQVSAVYDELQSIGDVSFSKDSRWLLTATSGGEHESTRVQMWECRTGKAVWPAIYHEDPASARFSGVDRLVTIEQYPQHSTKIRLFDSRTGRRVGPELRPLFGENLSDSDREIRLEEAGEILQEKPEDQKCRYYRTWRLEPECWVDGDLAVRLSEVAGGAIIEPATGVLVKQPLDERVAMLAPLLNDLHDSDDWLDALERTQPWNGGTRWNRRCRFTFEQYIASLLSLGNERALAELSVLDPGTLILAFVLTGDMHTGETEEHKESDSTLIDEHRREFLRNYAFGQLARDPALALKLAKKWSEQGEESLAERASRAVETTTGH